MDKYICLCGVSFGKKAQANLHEKLNEDMNQDYIRHKILKMSWKGRLSSFFWEYPWKTTFRLLGIYIIYMVLMKHFKVNLDVCESVLIGIAMGLMA